MRLKADIASENVNQNALQAIAQFKAKSGSYQRKHGSWAMTQSGKEHYNCTRFETGEEYTKIDKTINGKYWKTQNLGISEFIYKDFLSYMKANPEDKYFYPGRTHRQKELLYLSFKDKQDPNNIKARCAELGIINPTYIVTEFETQVVWVLDHYYMIDHRDIRKIYIRTEKLLEYYFPGAIIQNHYSRVINPYVYPTIWVDKSMAKMSCDINAILSKRYRKETGHDFSGFNEANLHDQIFNLCIKQIYKMSAQVYKSHELWREKDFRAWYIETFPELQDDPEFQDIPDAAYAQCKRSFKPVDQYLAYVHLEGLAVEALFAVQRFMWDDTLTNESLSEAEKCSVLGISKYRLNKLLTDYADLSIANNTLCKYLNIISIKNKASLPKVLIACNKFKDKFPNDFTADLSRFQDIDLSYFE